MFPLLLTGGAVSRVGEGNEGAVRAEGAVSAKGIHL